LEPGYYADGGNLYLQVSKSRSKSWIFRYSTVNKKGKRVRPEIGLGSLHTVTLAEARNKAEQYRKQIQDGIDPQQKRIDDQRAAKLAKQKDRTFKQCATAYIDDNSDAWRNAKHTQQWSNTLKTYVYPIFGDVPVKQIETDLVVKVLQPIWRTKTETASRVRGRIETVLDWAKVRGYRDGENPARWRGHLDKLFPKPSELKKEKHHAAIDYAEIGQFMSDLREREGNAAKGLELQILCGSRPGEVVGMIWDEINIKKKIWIIPGERMKAKKEHRVPLSEQAIAIINNQPRIEGVDYVFVGNKSGQPLSNMAFGQLLKRMERTEITAHGFRSAFRDWTAEQTAYPHELAEMALAHTIKNKAEAAYRRGDMIEKRRQMMQTWADYCDRIQQTDGETVVKLNARES